MEILSNDLLTGNQLEPEERLRRNLKDSLKEYNEVDLAVEIIQNALDAIDLARYEDICHTAGVDPASETTVHSWNNAVRKSLRSDWDQYSNLNSDRTKLSSNRSVG